MTGTTDTAITAPDVCGWPLLTPAEARVLGSLVEKALTTPEYYPLTLNALIAACNQRSNRDPVLALDEEAVALALDGLREKKLAWQVFLAGSRVVRFRHAFVDIYHVPDASVPLLTELLLRGPQTAAELRARAGRMQDYADVGTVETAMQGLADHVEGSFAVKLALEPGRRETRWAHLLCGPVTEQAAAAANNITTATPLPVAAAVSRVDRLEQEVAQMHTQLAELQARFESFTQQFGQ